MRVTERLCGALAGALGLVALALTLTQRSAQVVMGSAALYGPGISATNGLAVALPLALTSLAAELVCLSAWLDAGRVSPRCSSPRRWWE